MTSGAWKRVSTGIRWIRTWIASNRKIDSPRAQPGMLDEVDVLIIGSGHSGGMAAKVLTEKGISCVMLNAGPVADIRKDTELRQAFTAPYRRFRHAGRF